MVAKPGRRGRYVPDRGDVVWLRFTPQAGSEQAGHRPALVVSPKPYNRKVGLALVCPVTTRIKGYPFEVALPDGFGVTSAVLSDQVECVDWRARRARHMESVPIDIMREVTARIVALVDPEP